MSPGRGAGSGATTYSRPLVELQLEPDAVLERHRAGDAGLERAGGVERDVGGPRQHELVTVLDASVVAEEPRHHHARRLLEQLAGRT